MKIGIAYNAKQVDSEAVAHLAALIGRAGGSPAVFSPEDGIAGVDRLIVLGGDGTVLHAAKRASELGIPLFGINYGHIGFLTEFEQDEAEKAVGLVLDERPDIIVRALLEVDFNGVKKDCLNELALLREVSRGKDIHAGRLSVTIDGSSAGDFTADGLIVATPTGSTAYSLSAGGSILTPDCAAFLLTPVCAFSLKSRPIVYPDASVLSFSLGGDESLLAYGDGEFLGKVQAGDELSVKKSGRTATFLTRSRHEFFRRLTQKIN